MFRANILMGDIDNFSDYNETERRKIQQSFHDYISKSKNLREFYHTFLKTDNDSLFGVFHQGPFEKSINVIEKAFSIKTDLKNKYNISISIAINCVGLNREIRFEKYPDEEGIKVENLVHIPDEYIDERGRVQSGKLSGDVIITCSRLLSLKKETKSNDKIAIAFLKISNEELDNLNKKYTIEKVKKFNTKTKYGKWFQEHKIQPYMISYKI
ncbi:MAG: hypothetical protein M0R46_08155 [Candidatus Muirbacterium halophilum]|nr:hypothetical protein [Candidatus Muirbacterium halophilum]MCK9475875.1 hypothetical protein [Candidatus Muirbacterium halophilum]